MFAWLWRWAAGKAGEENARLEKALAVSQGIIAGLNSAVGQAFDVIRHERLEKLVLLASLTLQNGGEIRLPHTFIEAVQTGDYGIEFGPAEDGQGLVIRLKSPTPAPAGGGQPAPADPATTPFTPADAATPPEEPDGQGCPVCDR
jgi:hypothetical protein